MGNLIYYLNKEDEIEIQRGNWTILDKYERNKLACIKVKNIEDGVESLALYSEKYLYVLVISKQKDIANNDRAYQNGDGFHFVIAQPKEQNELADEFYVIGVSPLSNTKRRVFEWYKNIDFTGKPIDNGEIKHKIIGDRVYFLASIGWKDLTPYKPYIYEKLGFNISYARDDNGKKKIFILENDEYIRCENSLRNYRVYEFQKPRSGSEPLIVADLDRSNCKVNEDVVLRLGINSDKESVANMNVTINGKETMKIDKVLVKGLNAIKILLDNNKLIEANNDIKVRVKLNEHIFERKFNLYIYNEEKFNSIYDGVNRINKGGNKLLEESVNSLRFYCNDFQSRLSELKRYEEFEVLDQYIKDIEYKLKLVEEGQYLFERGQNLRLGLKSQIDESIQPYSLYIPKSVKDNDFKGLMVTLHGSGSDDRHGFNDYFVKLAEEIGIIMVSPYGRGTSHCYCTKEALEEVLELTLKIKKIFGIEGKKTILEGFSMGGYGVLRIYHYCNKEFDALAIFSGHHNLAEEFGFKNEPNYLDDENIELFKNTPMILYHGNKDGNCDFKEVKEFINKLKLVNDKAEVIISGCGHESLREEWYESFKQWVKKVIV